MKPLPYAITVTQMGRNVLGHAFGRINKLSNHIYILKTLPEHAKPFVLEHELYHLRDPEGHWLAREIRANWIAAWRHPIGFLIVLWLTITSKERLAFYLERKRRGV